MLRILLFALLGTTLGFVHPQDLLEPVTDCWRKGCEPVIVVSNPECVPRISALVDADAGQCDCNDENPKKCIHVDGHCRISATLFFENNVPFSCLGYAPPGFGVGYVGSGGWTPGINLSIPFTVCDNSMLSQFITLTFYNGPCPPGGTPICSTTVRLKCPACQEFSCVPPE